MTRTYTIAAVILCTVFLAAGLAQAEKPAKNVEPSVATFAYTPSTEQAPNSQGVTVAVAKASFFPSRVPDADDTWSHQLNLLDKIDPSTGEMLWFAFPQFQNLPARLRKDTAEILFAKGFKVRGPYESYSAIPAADKNTIDLYFIPKMKLIFTQRANKLNRGTDTIDTDIEVEGTVTLEVQKISTHESLWTKSIPLEKIAFTSRMPSAGYNVSDRFDSIMNEVAKGIERQYPTLMGSVAAAIDPQEIKALKKSSTGKTGY